MFTRLQVLILIALASASVSPATAQTTLHDNGPVASSVGTGFGGADENVLQTSLGLTTWGFWVSVGSNSTLADDFTITDPGGWQVDQVVVYAYETGSGLSSTITDVRIRIWSGDPSAGGVVVFGDLLTNRLASSVWSNTYRVDEATSGVAINRPIMENTVVVGTLLGPGTYWLEFQAAGGGTSGPFGPPLVITGQAASGNGLLTYNNGPYTPINNNGNVMDIPFRVEGNVAGITSFCTAKSGLVCGVPSISGAGIASATAGSGFTVSAGPARSCKSGILLYNTGTQLPGVAFNGGTLCVQVQGLRRAGSTNSMGTPGGANCDGLFSIDMNAFALGGWVVPNCDGSPSTIPPNNAAGFLALPGTSIFAAFWGRDSTTTGSFVSDGLSWTIGP